MIGMQPVFRGQVSGAVQDDHFRFRAFEHVVPVQERADPGDKRRPLLPRCDLVTGVKPSLQVHLPYRSHSDGKVRRVHLEIDVSRIP